MVRTLMTPRGEAITLTSDDPDLPPILSPEAAEILGDILNQACYWWRSKPNRAPGALEREIRAALITIGGAWLLEAERDG